MAMPLCDELRVVKTARLCLFSRFSCERMPLSATISVYEQHKNTKPPSSSSSTSASSSTSSSPDHLPDTTTTWSLCLVECFLTVWRTSELRIDGMACGIPLSFSAASVFHIPFSTSPLFHPPLSVSFSSSLLSLPLIFPRNRCP